MKITIQAIAIFALFSASVFGMAAHAEGERVALVNAHRVLAETRMAKTALAKLKSDFTPRENELIELSKSIKTKVADLEKQGATLSPSQLADKQHQLSDLQREFQRKQQQFNEDRATRQRDDAQRIIAMARGVVTRIAEADKWDIVIQDAVYVSPASDITNAVIRTMDASANQ